MRFKRNIKRWLSILLAVAVSLSSVMPTPVYAAGDESNDFTSSIASFIEHEMEKEAEARADAESCNRSSIFSPLFIFT